jgi:hypothetical protein
MQPFVTYFSGLDLGQTNDPTALAVMEQSWLPDPHHAGRFLTSYACRVLERFPLGTSYVDIVARVKGLFSADVGSSRTYPLWNTPLAVDQTGVGAAVVDMLKTAKPPALIKPVLITAGHAVKYDAGVYHVPKKELASVLQVLLQSGRLKIAKELPEAQALVRELENFKVKITVAANETFGAWREGDHDDLVLAVALACWLGENTPRYFDEDLGMTWGHGCPAATGYYGGYETAQDQRQRLLARERAMEESRLPPGQMTVTPYPGYVEPKFQ